MKKATNSRSNKKIWVYLFIALLFSFGCIRLYYNLTDDFRLSNITATMPYNSAWDFPLDENAKKELHAAASQKYYYIGKGAQVYAFGSEDGKYVLKFFKFKHLGPSPFISMLPSIGPLKRFKENNIARKERKKLGVFEGHAIAYQYDKEHSGLILLHLNLSNDLHLQTKLIDKIGRSHTVDLDQTIFVLQKRGETLRAVLGKHLKNNEISQASDKALQILHMYLDEYKNNVYDRDHGVSHNTGFIGDQPFHLDVGKFSYDEKMSNPDLFMSDLKHVAYKIKQWVQINYPEQNMRFLMEFDPKVSRLIAANTPASHPKSTQSPSTK